MRKIYSLILLVLCFSVFSQTKNYYYNSWRLGLNLGGMWQTSDLNKNPAGFAGGFTLEKGILENKSHFFSLAIRGRALFGNTYGFSSKKNYNVSANPALNGTYNTSVNYADTAGGPKFVYNNYKTQISEGALELQLSFNELRERTHVILNLWGGVGFSVYRTNTNLLDADGKMYNFSKIDSTGSSSNIIGSQKSFMDKSYESYAERSKNGNLFTFSPSAGIGLGYQFSQNFSMIFEYKVTFPQGINADLLDGHTGINNHWAGKNNDFYHYAGVNFLFTLGRGHTTKDSTHHVANTNTNANTGTNQNTNNQVGVTSGNTNPAFNKPSVTITNPGYSPYNSNTNTFEVRAKVYNVSSRSQLSVDFNGGIVSNYNFNGNDLSFNVNLLSGNNSVIITASNQGRSDTKSATINYSGNPPVINITHPLSNPFNTSSASLNVSASILNIASGGDLLVKFNGSIVNNFSYNSQSSQFSIPLNLILGNNTFEITASNNFGQDIKALNIVYTKQVDVGNTTTGSKLGLTITDPAASSITIKTNTYNVKAKVEGANSSSQIAVTVNGVNTPFNYDSNSGMITFDAPLISGVNPIVVSVKSGKSSTSKSTTINYETFVGETGSRSKVICYSKDKINFQTLTILQSEWPAYQALGAYEGPCKDKKIGEEGASNDPQIVICHRSVSGKKQTMNILQSQWAAHQAHGDVLGDCPKLELEPKEADVDPNITICHRNDDGSKQTIIIKQSQWTSHQAHDDIMGACPMNTGEGGGVDPDPIITICHKKVDGSKQTITIRQNQWASHQSHGDVMGACIVKTAGEGQDPEITICHRNENRSSQTIVILQSQWEEHKAHGDVLGACPSGNPEGGSSGDGIKICHRNNDGSKQTMVVSASAWTMHQAHGDILGECAVGTPTLGGSEQTIKICHKGENNIYETIDILQNQWAAHQAHGDHLGSCSNLELGIDIVICHIPPGNPNNPQTITISQNAWPAHQAHGDYLGSCSAEKIIKGGNTEVETVEPKKEAEQKTDGGQSAPRTIKGEVNKDEAGKSEPKTETGESVKTIKPR